MCNSRLLRGTVLAAILAAGVARAAPPDAATMLADADRFRQPEAAQQVETEVSTLAADGSVERQRRYTVFLHSERRSLVLMRSSAEAGQKVLMQGDDFWLLMPGSQRPMRITPQQKLLGDASTGDIATLSWTQDYSARLVGEEACGGDDAARRCWHLTLDAAHASSTYRRIELWLGLQRHEPVRAELYLQSDKLAKEARFELDRAGRQIDAMRLADRLSTRKTTLVRYLDRKPSRAPLTWFNPMFLARNPALES